MSDYVPCGGVIIFKGNKTAVVSTHKGRYSFPKGKREKGESFEQNAFRELQEETGITPDQVEVVKNSHIDEIKETGSVSVRYLIGRFIGTSHTFSYDTKELKSANWLTLDQVDALDKLFDRRKKVLREAYAIYKDVDSTFESGSEVANRATYTSPISQKKLIKVSKTMSWALRHRMTELGLVPDVEGYVSVKSLLTIPQLKDTTLEIVKFVVQHNDKKRFAMREVDGEWQIRANQGHSKKVADKLDDDKLLTLLGEPRDVCVHGTYPKAWDTIKTEGLKAMSRKHIHFASGEPGATGVISGMRSTAKVRIFVDMGKAMADGMKFYLSDNGVILTEGLDGVVLPKYFKEVTFME